VTLNDDEEESGELTGLGTRLARAPFVGRFPWWNLRNSPRPLGGAFFARLLSSTLMPKQPGLEPNAERGAYVTKRARELAMSGRYDGWRDIAVVLRFEEDFPEARHWLDHPSVRDNLDRLCARARQEPARQ
jgi:hypothetical protein